jgi:hypothetical protein
MEIAAKRVESNRNLLVKPRLTLAESRDVEVPEEWKWEIYGTDIISLAF